MTRRERDELTSLLRRSWHRCRDLEADNQELRRANTELQLERDTSDELFAKTLAIIASYEDLAAR